MAHQSIQNHEEMEDEEFPEEFQCFVCLDIMYKPVVLACGHISCFWCVFKAMDFLQVSHCPVCRNPYTHFPRICEVLHHLLLKLYPRAYRRRETQVAEEEKKKGQKSPQFDANDIDSQFHKVTDDQDIYYPLFGEAPIEPNASCGEDHSFVHNSSQITSHEDNTTIPTTSSSQTTTIKAVPVLGHTNKLLVTDLQCTFCKQLLCRPVVLNCGHVFCEACIHQHDSVCKCPLCHIAQPKGFPNVCLVLEHFLEENFPKEYSARKASSPHFQSASPSTKEQEHGANSLFSHDVVKSHPGVGCDYCGICPIIGLRYRCKDCVEKIGFDLCEGCYDSSSKLPGRFNQQHTKEHQFEIIQSPYVRSLRLLSEYSGEHGYGNGGNPDAEDDTRIVYFSNVGPEEENLEYSASLESPGEDIRDLENATTPPNPSNDHSEPDPSSDHSEPDPSSDHSEPDPSNDHSEPSESAS